MLIQLAGETEDAISLQQSVLDKIVKQNLKYPNLAVDAALRLAKWTDAKQALETLRNVEKIGTRWLIVGVGSF